MTRFYWGNGVLRNFVVRPMFCISERTPPKKNFSKNFFLGGERSGMAQQSATIRKTKHFVFFE